MQQGQPPIEGNPVVRVLLEETESDKEVNLLQTPTHTPSQSKSTSPFSCHRGWAMGRGRGMRREGQKPLNIQTRPTKKLNLSDPTQPDPPQFQNCLQAKILRNKFAIVSSIKKISIDMVVHS